MTKPTKRVDKHPLDDLRDRIKEASPPTPRERDTETSFQFLKFIYLCMLRDRLAHDMSYEAISTKYFGKVKGLLEEDAVLDVRTICENWGSEMMRQAMENTQGDKDHPAEPRFTLEDFNKNSRHCMLIMTDVHINNLERAYGFQPVHDSESDPGCTG